LAVSDEFILDDVIHYYFIFKVKACCEKYLADILHENPDHFQIIYEHSDKYNAL
jgi:hypothetical protein